MRMTCKTEKDTFLAGKALGETLNGGDVVLLDGFLGAGKTVFSKGIAAALGVGAEILSPTFSIMCEYPTAKGCTLCHMDAYRLQDVLQAEEAGVLEVLGRADTISVVEWYQNIGKAFEALDCTRVTIIEGEQQAREIVILKGEHHDE